MPERQLNSIKLVKDTKGSLLLVSLICCGVVSITELATDEYKWLGSLNCISSAEWLYSAPADDLLKQKLKHFAFLFCSGVAGRFLCLGLGFLGVFFFTFFLLTKSLFRTPFPTVQVSHRAVWCKTVAWQHPGAGATSLGGLTCQVAVCMAEAQHASSCHCPHQLTEGRSRMVCEEGGPFRP